MRVSKGVSHSSWQELKSEVEAFLDNKLGLGMGENSGVFGSKGGGPPFADGGPNPWGANLDTSGKRTLSGGLASALDLAIPVTSVILSSFWWNKATAAVSEPGRVPKDRVRP